MIINPAQLRNIARLSMGAGITLLFGACLCFYSRWMPVVFAALAALVSMSSNAVLIANSTQSVAPASVPAGSSQPGYTEVNGWEEAFDSKNCIQGYAMLPITAMSVVSVAMYKAAADVADIRDADDGHPHVFFAGAILKFVGCEQLVNRTYKNTPEVQEDTVVAFHTKFLHGVICAVCCYLVIYGCRAGLTARFPSEKDDAEEGRTSRQAARAGFGAAVIVLVFAAVGFFPLVLASISSAISVLASVGMFLQGSSASARMLIQSHAFMPVTLSCVYCLGTLLLEEKAMAPDADEAILFLHLVGFQQAFFCACWLAGSMAVREMFNAAQEGRA